MQENRHLYIGKAVLIPESNKDELILNSEIEEAVRRGGV